TGSSETSRHHDEKADSREQPERETDRRGERRVSVREHEREPEAAADEQTDEEPHHRRLTPSSSSCDAWDVALAACFILWQRERLAAERRAALFGNRRDVLLNARRSLGFQRSAAQLAFSL